MFGNKAQQGLGPGMLGGGGGGGGGLGGLSGGTSGLGLGGELVCVHHSYMLVNYSYM